MINKYSNVPLYSQLKELIIQKIESGEYPENSKIPSEQELCDNYDISRPTVRQAVSELTNSGYLYKEKGKGTFVSKPKTFIDIKSYSGFTDSILDSQIPGDRNIVSYNVIKPYESGRLCEIFNVLENSNSEFAEIKYLTVMDGDAMAVNSSYIPISLFPDIVNDIKDRKPSYDIMRGKYPLLPVKTKSTMEVVFSDTGVSQFLQIQVGQPVIKIENVLYSKSGQAVEFIVTSYRADKCRLVFENNK
ncbi:MAG: GntR family transcriptional regulator [Bacillota bacterium]|nr:GntR family transcriptional regulator [Bacillota bacterium]